MFTFTAKIVVLDGVYYLDDRGQIRFRRLPPPKDAEVARVTACIARQVARLLERRGQGPSADPKEADHLPRNQPLLAELYSASMQGRIAVGPCAGNWVTLVGTQPEEEDAAVPSFPRCAGRDYTAIVSGEVFYVDDAPKIYVRPDPYNEHVTFHDLIEEGPRNPRGSPAGPTFSSWRTSSFRRWRYRRWSAPCCPLFR